MNKKHVLKYALIACIIIFSHQADAETENFEDALTKSKSICENIFSPNSMARIGDLRTDEEFSRLENERRNHAKIFFSASGVEYIRQQLLLDKDEANDICLLKILQDSKRQDAILIIKSYTTDRSNEGYEVSLTQHAREILNTLTK